MREDWDMEGGGERAGRAERRQATGIALLTSVYNRSNAPDRQVFGLAVSFSFLLLPLQSKFS